LPGGNCQRKFARLAKCPYLPVGVLQLGEIYLCGTSDNLCRDARDVVASNKGAGRTLAAADGPLLRDKRKGELLEAKLGVANVSDDEHMISSNGESSSKQHTGTEKVRDPQVLAFVWVFVAVVLVRPVGCTRRVAVRCSQSRDNG
jgi:hypothetical protein